MSNAEKEKLKKYNKWIQYLIQNCNNIWAYSLSTIMVDLMTKKYKHIELHFKGKLPNLDQKDTIKQPNSRGIKLIITINGINIEKDANFIHWVNSFM